MILDAANIPGVYRPDEGVDIYNRNGTGYHIGNALPGEWCEYTVSVANEGAYNADFLLASLQGGGTFKVKIGEVESDTLTALEYKQRFKYKSCIHCNEPGSRCSDHAVYRAHATRLQY